MSAVVSAEQGRYKAVFLDTSPNTVSLILDVEGWRALHDAVEELVGESEEFLGELRES